MDDRKECQRVKHTHTHTHETIKRDKLGFLDP